MFGYVVIDKPELRIREYEVYHSYYCGICESLKRYVGAGRLTLSYDMTFLAMLLTGLYEPEEEQARHRCVLHPSEKLLRTRNRFSDYAADMNVLLAYYDLADDWKDEKHLRSGALAAMTRADVRRIETKYPRQAEAVRTYVKQLSVCEAERSGDPDLAAGLTGTMFAEIFVQEEDLWASELRRIGFFLGKFIYLMDAYEDMEHDREKNQYNVWLCREQEPAPEQAYQLLSMMMSECAISFERLPILTHADILRNILYSGVWTKFRLLEAKRRDFIKENAND